MTDHFDIHGMVDAVNKGLPPNCELSMIPVLTISRGVNLLLILTMLGFLSGFSSFPPPTKIGTSKFQFDVDSKHLKHELGSKYRAQKPQMKVLELNPGHRGGRQAPVQCTTHAL